MGIHYDYKSKRGERAVLRQAKREARLARKRAKRKVADFRIKDTREFRDWVNKTLVQNTERLNGINEKIELHHTQTMQRLDSIDNLLNIQNGRIRASEKIGNINRGAGMFISALFAVLLIVIALMK